MEMELLERERLVADIERAAFGDDLDSRTQILKLGPVRHVGYRDPDGGGWHQPEGTLDHVDGRLAPAGRAEPVGGIKAGPVQRSLDGFKQVSR